LEVDIAINAGEELESDKKQILWETEEAQ